jgi:hypothetical protein
MIVSHKNKKKKILKQKRLFSFPPALRLFFFTLFSFYSFHPATSQQTTTTATADRNSTTTHCNSKTPPKKYILPCFLAKQEAQVRKTSLQNSLGGQRSPVGTVCSRNGVITLDLLQLRRSRLRSLIAVFVDLSKINFFYYFQKKKCYAFCFAQKILLVQRKVLTGTILIYVVFFAILSNSIHFSTEGWGPITRPAIPGHEIVGIVVKRGEDASHQIGDRVGVGCLVSCCRGTSVCDWCRKGEDQFCQNKTVTFSSPYKDGRGGISEGGFADRIRVYSDYAFKSEFLPKINLLVLVVVAIVLFVC